MAGITHANLPLARGHTHTGGLSLLSHSSAPGTLGGLGNLECFPALSLGPPVLFQFNPRGTDPRIINNAAY